MACSSNAEPVSPSAAERKALLVDSGPEINNLLDSVLTKEGWSILRLSDNQAVLSVVTANPFDLVITAPKTHGPEDLELLGKIRRVRPNLRLIILTNEWTPGDVIAAMREHAFSYFSGPFDLITLADIVRSAMTSPCWDDGIEILSATPAWVQVAARCDSETADRLVQFLRAAKLPGISEAAREEMIFAFREILMNAIEHGGNFDPSQYVEISIIHSRRAITCRVKDPGQGFSLEELRHAAINSPTGDLFSHDAVREAQGLRPGGFGLLMAEKLVDELIYNDKGNDVLLIKYLGQISSQTYD